MPAQARGDGSEVRVTVGVEADKLGGQDHAVPAQASPMGASSGNSQVASLPGRVRSVSRPRSTRTWARIPSHFTSSTHRGGQGGWKGGGARQHRRDEPGELVARHRQIKRTGVAQWPGSRTKTLGGRLRGALLELVVALERDQHRSHLVALREHHLLKLALI